MKDSADVALLTKQASCITSAANASKVRFYGTVLAVFPVVIFTIELQTPVPEHSWQGLSHTIRLMQLGTCSADDDAIDELSEEEVEGEDEEADSRREARRRLKKEAKVSMTLREAHVHSGPTMCTLNPCLVTQQRSKRATGGLWTTKQADTSAWPSLQSMLRVWVQLVRSELRTAGDLAVMQHKHLPLKKSSGCSVDALQRLFTLVLMVSCGPRIGSLKGQ